MARNFHRKRRVPFDVLLLALGMVAVGVVAFTAAVTASEYGNLPERIPTHFGFNGAPNAYGPRAVLWLLVAIQLVALAAFALGVAAIRESAASAPTPLGFGVFAVCILGILAHAQFGIIAAAKSPQPRFPTRPFMGFVFALTALALLAMRFL
jgi:hypothetical protein